MTDHAAESQIYPSGDHRRRRGYCPPRPARSHYRAGACERSRHLHAPGVHLFPHAGGGPRRRSGGSRENLRTILGARPFDEPAVQGLRHGDHPLCARGAEPLPAALSAPERHRRVSADGKPQRRYPPRYPGDLFAHRRAGRRAASASLDLCSRALYADRHRRERHTGHGGGPSARRGVPGAAPFAARAPRPPGPRAMQACRAGGVLPVKVLFVSDDGMQEVAL